MPNTVFMNILFEMASRKKKKRKAGGVVCELATKPHTNFWPPILGSRPTSWETVAFVDILNYIFNWGTQKKCWWKCLSQLFYKKCFLFIFFLGFVFSLVGIHMKELEDILPSRSEPPIITGDAEEVDLQDHDMSQSSSSGGRREAYNDSSDDEGGHHGPGVQCAHQ